MGTWVFGQCIAALTVCTAQGMCRFQLSIFWGSFVFCKNKTTICQAESLACVVLPASALCVPFCVSLGKSPALTRHLFR